MAENLDFTPVLTRASLLLQNKNQNKDFQAIVFEEPKFEQKSMEKRKIIEGRGKNNKFEPKTNDNEFDIKKARHEVLNFAMNNQTHTKNKDKMKISQLIKLGAKPPKNKYKNYKQLLEEKKRNKTLREKRAKLRQLGKSQTGMASVNCRSKSKIEKQKKNRLPVRSIDKDYGVVKSKNKKK